MGSFKGNGRDQGPNRRRRPRGQQSVGFLGVESLERRSLLAVTPFQPTNANIADVTNGPMASSGQTLINVYLAFQKAGDASTLPAQFPNVQFKGNTVAVGVNGTGDLNAFQ